MNLCFDSLYGSYKAATDNKLALGLKGTLATPPLANEKLPHITVTGQQSRKKSTSAIVKPAVEFAGVEDTLSAWKAIS